MVGARRDNDADSNWLGYEMIRLALSTIDATEHAAAAIERSGS